MSETTAPDSMGASGTMGESNFMARVFGEESGVGQAFGLGVWFGGWRCGRLGRIGYIVAAFVLYGMLGAIQWFILDALKPDPFQLTPTSEPMSEFAQSAMFAAPLAMSALTLVVGLNIAAKRLRDVGLPGFVAAIGLFVLLGVLAFVLPGKLGAWATLGGLAILAIIPGGLLGKRAPR